MGTTSRRSITINKRDLAWMNTLEIADGTIAYIDIAGDSALPCLVFLHEGLGCAAMWGHVPRQLCEATGCRGLVFDRRGYGQSSSAPGAWRPGYLHAAATHELPQVLERLVPADVRYLLVGHSDGGSIALIHGADRPPGLAGIVTIAAHVFVEAVTLAGIRDAVAAYDAGKLAGLARYHGSKTDDVFRGWSGAWLAPAFASWNIEALLPHIEVPTLALQGANDQYGTARQIDAIAQGVGGRAQAALLPDCAHAPHKECPDALLAAAAGFVRAVVTDDLVRRT